jgi:hypothetical protein
MATIAARNIKIRVVLYTAESGYIMAILEYPTIILPDGDKRFRSLELNELGELIYEQTDLGKRTAELAPNGGDSDYEYWVIVQPIDANNVVLELIRDRFSTQRDFKKWLDRKNIKYMFLTY